MKLPPLRTGGHERTREVPYMRYGHTAVLLDDTIYLWGGRNDTEGACNVLYAFDVSKYGSIARFRQALFPLRCNSLKLSSEETDV